MTVRIACKLNAGKILLAVAGIWAAAGPPLLSLLKAQQAAPSQTAPLPGKPLTFDVASVKPFSPAPVGGGRKGGGGGATGPGTPDPGRIHYTAIRLKDLLMAAYSVRDFQIIGPGWLDSIDETTRFTIDATMSPETTKEQLREMLQNLLAERFKLTIHRETRVYPKYSMIVAKNGPEDEGIGGSAGSQGPTLLRRGEDAEEEGRLTRTDFRTGNRRRSRRNLETLHERPRAV